MIQMLDLLHTVFGPVDIVSSREVSALIKLAGMTPLRTYAMTDALKALGFEKVDRPPNPRGHPAHRPLTRVWHVPGSGVCTMYARSPYGIAEVKSWIALRKQSIPDGRTTRWQDKPAGKAISERARLAEMLFIARKSKQPIPAEMLASAVSNGLMCEICHVKVVATGRRQCNKCLTRGARFKEHQRKHAPTRYVPPVPGLAPAVHIPTILPEHSNGFDPTP